jgi:hypothetical protein
VNEALKISESTAIEVVKRKRGRPRKTIEQAIEGSIAYIFILLANLY